MHEPVEGLKLLSPPRFMIYCLSRAIRYPTEPIRYWECCACGAKFMLQSNNCVGDHIMRPPNKCPKCGVSL